MEATPQRARRCVPCAHCTWRVHVARAAGTILSYAKDSQSTDESQRVADFNHFVIFDPRVRAVGERLVHVPAAAWLLVSHTLPLPQCVTCRAERAGLPRF